METNKSPAKIISVTRTSGVECVHRGLQEIEAWTDILSLAILRTFGKGEILLHNSK